jgi:hypothetical protein
LFLFVLKTGKSKEVDFSWRHLSQRTFPHANLIEVGVAIIVPSSWSHLAERGVVCTAALEGNIINQSSCLILPTIVHHFGEQF